MLKVSYLDQSKSVIVHPQQFAFYDKTWYTCDLILNKNSLECSVGDPLQKQVNKLYQSKNMAISGRGLSWQRML